MSIQERGGMVWYEGPATVVSGDGTELDADATIWVAAEEGMFGDPAASWEVIAVFRGDDRPPASTACAAVEVRLPGRIDLRVSLSDVCLETGATTLTLTGSGQIPAVPDQRESA